MMIESVVELIRVSLMTATLLSTPASEISLDDYMDLPVFCLAQNIYHEARGETREGLVAVAQVTINRVKRSDYPDTICGVVFQKIAVTWDGRPIPPKQQCAFSWFCDGKSDIMKNDKAWNKSLKIALSVLTGGVPDPTRGATHYWNPEKANPNWGYPLTAFIGRHLFAARPLTT